MKDNDYTVNADDVKLKPIGFVDTDETDIPRHWTVSTVIGKLVIEEEYREGLDGIQEGNRIQVIFLFHRSPPFSPQYLRQTPPHSGVEKGVFSTCSPKRPNPIGVSVVEVLKTEGNALIVKGLDMLKGTPILDIKPMPKNVKILEEKS